MENQSVKNYNVGMLSLAFMLVFTGFNTMSGIQVRFKIILTLSYLLS